MLYSLMLTFYRCFNSWLPDVQTEEGANEPEPQGNDGHLGNLPIAP